MRVRMTRFCVLAFSLCCACGAQPMVDAGSGDDAGGRFDAGASVDAGRSGDAGADDAGAQDAGATDDAGVFDAGMTIDAGPGSSMGAGGLTCLRTGSVTTSEGARSYCVAKVGDVEFKVIEPSDLTTNRAPLRLALYLHGDGARTYTNDTAPRFHAAWTTSHHVLYVIPLAANGCAWWVKPGFTACDDSATVNDRDQDGVNAAALEAVVTAVRAGWNVADEGVLYGGASGGSIFLSADYLPRYGSAHPGTWALSCGGEVPWVGVDGDVTRSFLSFTWGDQDFLAPDITAAVSWFSDAGVPLATQVVAGADHCGFDHLGRTVEIWNAQP